MPHGTDETSLLLSCDSTGEKQRVFADIFTRHREKLRSMGRLRLDRRVQARVDPSDVLQDAYVEASRRLDEYLRGPPMPLLLWLRRVTGQKLQELHRHHLVMQKRNAGREVSIGFAAVPHTTTEALAVELLARGPSPSAAALRARLEEVLDRMDATDREIVALRHFEQLSSAEAAEVLGIKEEAARKRYLRAMKKLRDILAGMPGWQETP
jgi:RNA polymerase sigma-70 factor (ECF subfamily)